MPTDVMDKPKVEVLTPEALTSELVGKLNVIATAAQFTPHILAVNEWRSLVEKNTIVIAKIGERVVGMANLISYETGWGLHGAVTDFFVHEPYRSHKDHDIECKLVGEIVGVTRDRGYTWLRVPAESSTMRSVCRMYLMDEQEVEKVFALEL